jgi:RND superfamily putative drug exporter
VKGVKRTRSIAARAGRWSATHRKTAIWGWLAFVFIAFAIGSAVGTNTLQQDQLGVGESGRAARTIEGAFERSAEELVLVQSDTATATDPSFRAVVDDVQRRLKDVPYTQDLEGPYAAGNAGQISADGRSALIRFEIVGDDDQTQERVGAALDAVSAAQAANPDFTIGESGDASVNKQIEDAVSDDFKRALLTSLPITLLILLLAFGAVVAALVPLLLGLTAVIATSA